MFRIGVARLKTFEPFEARYTLVCAPYEANNTATLGKEVIGSI